LSFRGLWGGGYGSIVFVEVVVTMLVLLVVGCGDDGGSVGVGCGGIGGSGGF
jgi:hypothetical protein